MRIACLVMVLGILTLPANGAFSKQGLLKGLLSSEEKVDLDGDGKMDRWNTLSQGTIVVRKTDLNGDGAVDITDYFNNRGDLYKREISALQNGKIDTWITFEPNGRVFKEWDTNQDGIIDKTEESRPRGNRIFVRIRSNLDKSPKLVRESFRNLPAMQPADEHAKVSEETRRALGEIKGAKPLTGDLEPLKKPDGKRLCDTAYGFKIHENCLAFFGKEKNEKEEEVERVNRILHETLLEGLACMWELGGEDRPNKTQNFPRELVSSFGALLANQEKPAKLYCEEGKLEPLSEAAAASAGPTEKSSPYQHPVMILNTAHFAAGSKPPTLNAEEDFVKRTLFHELFHNIGVIHGNGIEFAWACSHHCFPPTKRPMGAMAAHAKSICKADYSRGAQDVFYLNDLARFAPYTGDFTTMNNALAGGIVSNPGMSIYPLLYAQANAHPWQAPVGAPYAELIYPEKLSEPGRAVLKRAAEEMPEGPQRAALLAAAESDDLLKLAKEREADFGPAFGQLKRVDPKNPAWQEISLLASHEQVRAQAARHLTPEIAAKFHDLGGKYAAEAFDHVAHGRYDDAFDSLSKVKYPKESAVAGMEGSENYMGYLKAAESTREATRLLLITANYFYLDGYKKELATAEDKEPIQKKIQAAEARLKELEGPLKAIPYADEKTKKKKKK